MLFRPFFLVRRAELKVSFKGLCRRACVCVCVCMSVDFVIHDVAQTVRILNHVGNWSFESSKKKNSRKHSFANTHSRPLSEREGGGAEAGLWHLITRLCY